MLQKILFLAYHENMSQKIGELFAQDTNKSFHVLGS